MSTQHEQLHELIAEQAAEWYLAHRDGGLDETQSREFMRWLRTSPAHVAEYLSVAGIAHDLADAARASEEPLERLLAEAGMENVVSLDGDPIDPPAAYSGRLKPTLQERTRTADRAADRAADHTADRAADHTADRAVTRRADRAVTRRAGFSPPSKPTKRWPGAGVFGPRTTALAATMLLAFAATLWLAVTPNRYTTGHGEQRTLQLPDNTVVRLNSDSEIDVDFDDKRRSVEVERGQVYFEVAEDAARPFTVVAGNHLIEDIGTAFDVYRKRERVTVTVVEGRVRIWDRETPAVPAEVEAPSPSKASPAASPSEPVADIEAGTQVRLAAAGPVEVANPAEVRQAVAWIQNKIVFDKDPIAEVAAEFNRYNHQQIHIDDPGVGAIPISGVFRTYDVRSFVAFLNRLPGVHAEQTADNIVVTGEPARARRADS